MPIYPVRHWLATVVANDRYFLSNNRPGRAERALRESYRTWRWNAAAEHYQETYVTARSSIGAAA